MDGSRLVRQLPRSYEDIFGAAARFAPASSRPEAADPSTQQRIVQMELIRGPEHWRHLLVDCLPSWVTPVRLMLSLVCQTYAGVHTRAHPAAVETTCTGRLSLP